MNCPDKLNSDYLNLQFDIKTEAKIVYAGLCVMSNDERPYFEMLLSQFRGNEVGSVLEVGFGLGISAGMIQEILCPNETHDIIEIELSIFQDLCAFAKAYPKVSPILGDAYSHVFSRKYDFLFYDSFDYDLSLLSLENPGSKEDYSNKECEFAHQVLKIGGILCHPFFGDLEMPELPGFLKKNKGTVKVSTFPLWNGELCDIAQVGYYIKEE